MRSAARWLLCLCLGTGFGMAGAWAQGLQPVPELRARVMDATGTLDAVTTARIEAQLAAFEQSNGSQVVVVMVATTAPEDIADYTQRLGDAWKIGRREVGDGVLFVIAKDDRRLRIAPAKALEGALPDLLAPDAVFRSPMAHTPYPGAPVVSMILNTVINVFEDFTYHRELELFGQLGMTPVLGDGVSLEIGCWAEACVAARAINNAGEMNGFLKTSARLFANPLPFSNCPKNSALFSTCGIMTKCPTKK